MVLAIIFLLLAFALIVLLWGGSMLLQGWLYQAPADRLPIRAAAGGLALAAFLTFWCLLYRNDPGKYDTLFEFSPLEVTEYDSFDTVMRKADGNETVIRFRKVPGSRGATTDFVDEKGQPWKKNTSDSMAVAILVPEKGKDEPTRFEANLDDKGNFPRELAQLRYTDKSGRYMGADSLGRVYRQKTGVLLANILLNALHFVLWWMVLWFGVRFSIWHAFGLALVLWLFTMIVVQPMLFNHVKPQEAQSALRQRPDYADARMCMMSPS